LPIFIGKFSVRGERLSLEKPKVVVIDADRQDGRQLCDLLQNLNYSVSLIHSLKDLEQELHKDPEVAVILDLDTVPVNNQFFRGLRKIHPQLHMLGVSKLSYHPGLEEVIGSHLLACLVKPLDVEELCFWLKSISEHLANPVREAEG
jgi:DNA-binding NtrC family response regulator